MPGYYVIQSSSPEDERAETDLLGSPITLA